MFKDLKNCLKFFLNIIIKKNYLKKLKNFKFISYFILYFVKKINIFYNSQRF